MKPRGRKVRVATTTLPPKDYYLSHPAPLVAVREGRVSLSAAHLWAVIRGHAWQDGRCDLSDRELCAWMGGLTERQIRNLRSELAAAGLLATGSGEHGVRWLTALPWDDRKYISGEMYFPGNGPVKEEEVNINTNTPPPPPIFPGHFPGNVFPPNCDAVTDAVVLAGFLVDHGAFPSVAATLAGDLLARMPLGEAQAYCLGHLTAIEQSADARYGRIDAEGVLGRWVARLQGGAQPPAWAVQEAEAALAGVSACQLSLAQLTQPASFDSAGEANRGLAHGSAQDASPDALEADDAEQCGGGEEAEERQWTLPGGRACSHQELWVLALSQLRLQLPAETFDAWLARSCCTGMDDPARALVVQVRGRGGAEWVAARLKRLVLRTLVSITGQDDLDVRFEEG